MTSLLSDLSNGTKNLKRALDSVMADHPKRTAVGLFIGQGICTLTKLFDPLLKRLESINVQVSTEVKTV
ncbi:hypothetical protein KAR48_08845, partial [bacterium]|nr:hypothetical protein [bacterium]